MKKQIKIFLFFFTGIFLIIFLIHFATSFYFVSTHKELPPSVETFSNESKLLPEPIKIEMKILPGKIEPKEIKLKAGQEIFLTIVSMEGKHSIVFEGPGLSWLHANFDEPGETLQFHLFAPAQGEYQFFCQEPNHRESGEEGVIIVE
jgi:plastocyanin